MNVADNFLRSSAEGVNSSDVAVLPVGRRVLFTKYDKNPYREVETTEDGVILGADDLGVSFSSDTGEMESNIDVVVAAKVIAVGADCKYVEPGDDIFISTVSCTPVPFRNKKYFLSDEIHAMCVMKNK